MRSKKTLTLLLAIIMVVSMLAGCGGTTPAGDAPAASSNAPAASADGDNAPAVAAKDVITVSMNVMDAEKCGNNPKSDYIKDTFGIEFEYIPVSWGDWGEKIRTWVSANDMPDLVWWDLKGASSQEYKTWASQGAFTEIPMAKLQARPELNRLASSMKSVEAMKVDGKLYAWPANRNNPEVAQNTYTSHWVYRRDIAKELGMYNEGDVYTYDEWVALIKAAQAKDPNMAGLVMDSWAFPHAPVLFIGPVPAEGNETCSYIKGADGKYIWPPTTPEYKDGVLKTYELFQDGVIYKDNIQFKASEPTDMFVASRAFAKYNGGASVYNDLQSKLLKAGLTTDPEAVGPAIVTFDGKFWMTQTEDYWSVTAFSNEVDEAKMDRILNMWDYLQSDEGMLFQWIGFEGKDYEKAADGSVKVLWEVDSATGQYVNPYSEMRFGEFQSAGLTRPGNPADAKYGIEQNQMVWDYMGKNPVGIKVFDYDVSFMSAPNKDKYGTYGADVKTKLIELLQTSKDIEGDWDAFVASMMPKVQPVLDEINAAVK